MVVARVPTAVVQVQQKRWAETAAGADKLVPPTAGKATAASPKIEALVNDIAKLTLLETADLVALLKQKLNIADVQMAAPVAAGAAPAAAAAPAVCLPFFLKNLFCAFVTHGRKNVFAGGKACREDRVQSQAGIV